MGPSVAGSTGSMWMRTEVSGGWGGTALGARLSTSWLSSLWAPDCCEPLGVIATSVSFGAGGPLFAANEGGGVTHRYAGRRPMPSNRRRPLGALWQDAPRAIEVDGHDGKAPVHAEVGGAAAEGLGPAVGAAAALWEDHEAPTLVEQGAGLLQGPAVDSPTLDGQGPEHKGRECALHAGVEEVVSGRGDDGPMAPAVGQSAQQQRRVEVALVVGDEDHRTFESFQPIDAVHVGWHQGPNNRA